MRPRTLTHVLLGLLLATLFGLTACSSTSVDVRANPGLDMATYRVYSWLPLAREGTGDPRFDDELIHSQIVSAIEQELETRGYVLSQGTEPDFLIAYHAAVKRQIHASAMYEDHGYRPGWSWAQPTTQVTSYDEGTLILDLLEARTRKIVWRAALQARVDSDASPKKREKRIIKAVARMMESLPESR
ncbi:MAG: DUF4136 domain-containing protein, partial [Planctomycetota bacterium]